MSGFFWIGCILLVWSVRPGQPQPTDEYSLLIGNDKATLGYNNAFAAERNYRQSFCDQYEMALNNSLPTASALEGKEVHVLLTGYTNYNEATGLDNDYPGLFPKILDEIAERGNFTWRQSFGIVTNKQQPNKTYTDLLQWGTQNYDIYVGEWDVTSARINLGIAFTKPVLDSALIMIRNVDPNNPNDDVAINWWFWFYPFDTIVWVLIIIQLIVSGFVYQYIEYLVEEKEEERDNQSFRERTIKNQSESCYSYFNGSKWAPTSAAGRVFIISNLAWVLFLNTAYSANLTTFMVVTAKSELVLNTIQDAIDNNMSMCIEAGTNGEEYITRKYPGALSLLVPQDSVDAMYTALNDGECDVVLGGRKDYDIYNLKDEFNPDCQLTWQGHQVLDVDAAFATIIDPGNKCTLLVTSVFTYYLERLSEDGTLGRLWMEEVQNKADATCAATNESYDGQNRRRRRHLQNEDPSDGGNNSNPKNSDDADASSYQHGLTLRSMSGTFLLHLCLSTVAIIIGLISNHTKSSSQAMELESNTMNVDSQKQNRRDFPASSSSSSHGKNTDAKIDTLLSMITTVHDKQQRQEIELEQKLDAVLLMMKTIQDQKK